MEESNCDVTAPHPCSMRRDAIVKSVAFRVDGDGEQRHHAAVASQQIEDDSMTNTLTSSGKNQGEFFPGLHPVVFGCLRQTSVPRIWFLRIVANPYPFVVFISSLRVIYI